MARILEKFRVCDDDGKLYDLVIIESPRIDASTADGPASLPGRRYVRTVHGAHVNRIDDDTFEIVTTGKIVRRV